MSNYIDQIRNNDGMMEDLHDNWVNEQERKDEKRKQLITKFPCGEQRYKDGNYFRCIIDCLVKGADPYEVIDQLIIHRNDAIEKWMQEIQKSKLL